MILPPIQTAIRDDEAAFLAETCEGKTVLELGAELGFSTIVLGQVAKSVVSVDWHKGYIPGAINFDGLGPQDTLWDWYANMENYLPGAVGKTVFPIVGRFEDVLPWLKDGSFDVVFLDGGHERAGVEFCIGQVARLGRYFITHDYGARACLERIVLNELGWEPDKVVGTMARGLPPLALRPLQAPWLPT